MTTPALGPQRRAFLEWLTRQDGKTALWAAKGPEVFDCSGLVTCGYQASGVAMLDPKFTNTDKLWNLLPATELPSPGDLALYGGKGPDVDHVMVWFGDGCVYGACGASSKIQTKDKADEAGARVRMRKLHYRKDFRGFRRSPLDIADLVAKQKEVT